MKSVFPRISCESHRSKFSWSLGVGKSRRCPVVFVCGVQCWEDSEQGLIRICKSHVESDQKSDDLFEKKAKSSKKSMK